MAPEKRRRSTRNTPVEPHVDDLFPNWKPGKAVNPAPAALSSTDDEEEECSDQGSATRFELHLADCIEGMTQLPASSVDVVVTSPPYNLGIDYGTYRDDRSVSDYLMWTRDWAGEVRRLLKPNGSFFLNIGASPANPLLPHQVVLELAEQFQLQNTLHWIKSITVDTTDGETVSAGHFKPINSKRFVNDCHEFVFHFTLSGDVTLDRRGIGVPYVHKSNITRWKHSEGHDKRCRGNTWFVPYKTIMSRDKDRPHPATFPVKLADYCLRLHGTPPDDTTALDPFVGIGHSAEAARALGVSRFIGFDIDEGYLQTACERLGCEMLGA